MRSGVPCRKLDVVKWRGVPSRGVTRSDGNLERVEIRAVNAPIVADGELVAALDVTTTADGCDGPIGQERVDKGFHGCCFGSSLLIKAKCRNRPAVRDAVALLYLSDFQDCGVASLRDAHPGDHIGLIAVWKFAS